MRLPEFMPGERHLKKLVSDIKPCPFCGQKSGIEIHRDYLAYSPLGEDRIWLNYTIHCHYGSCNYVSISSLDITFLINWWNRRSP